MEKNKKNFNYKKILKSVGYFIAILSLFYIIWIGFKQWQIIKELLDLREKWPGILFATIIYAVLMSLISSTIWKKIIAGFGGKITFKESFIILGKSQIAKYIPGNVFQYFGRHFLTKDLDIPNGVIINGILIETVLFASSAVIIFFISALLYGFNTFLFEGIDNYLILVSIILIAFIIIAILIFVLIRFIPRIKEKLIKHNLFFELKTLDFKKIRFHLIICIILLMIFFISTGCLMWFLNKYLWQDASGKIIFFVGAYSIAWVIGFITPGASGGIGVREAILAALLNNYTSEAKALSLAIVLRLVTILGDLIFYFGTYIVKSTKRDNINV